LVSEALKVRFRSTLIYLVVAIVLIAFYLYETREKTKEQSAKEEAKQVLSFKLDLLESITLKREKDSIQLEKKESGGQGVWEIVSPRRLVPDSFVLSRMTKRLADLKYERVISENPQDLAEFGLDKPSLSIAYRAGKEEGTLSFGSKSPIGQSIYAMHGGSKKVFLVASLDKQELDKSLFDLRNKKLFTLVTDKLNQVTFEQDKTEWVFNKKDDRWILQDDPELKVDREKLEGFVRPIVWAEAQSFEAEENNDLRPYGLRNPAARIVLADGTKSEEMFFGEPVKDKKEESIYAMVKGKPQVVTVRKRLLEDLPKEKEQFKETEPEQPKKEEPK
jgi:hypothetical protein